MDQGALLGQGLRVLLLHELHGGQNGAERVAQLVPEHRQELVALPHAPVKLQKEVPDLVLPASGAQRHSNRARQRDLAGRTVEKGHVGELGELAHGRTVRLDPAFSPGKHEEGELGPRKLAREDSGELPERSGIQSLLRQEERPGASLDLALHVVEAGADPGVDSGAREHLARERGVAPGRGEHEDPILEILSFRRRHVFFPAAGPAPSVLGRPRQNPPELLERRPEPKPVAVHRELPDRALVTAAAFLRNRDGFPNLPLGFEVAQEEDRVGEVADVDRNVQVGAHEAVLRHRRDHGDPALAQIAEELVELDGKQLLLGHRIVVAVEAVDDDDPGVVVFHGPTDQPPELTGRKLRGIDLLHPDDSAVHLLLQGQAQRPRASEQGGRTFVEGEDGDVLPAPCRRRRELRCDRGLAGAGRAEQQSCRAALDSAAQKPIELGNPAREELVVETHPMLRGDETGEDDDPTGLDAEIVEPAPEVHAAQLSSAASAGARRRTPAPSVRG